MTPAVCHKCGEITDAFGEFREMTDFERRDRWFKKELRAGRGPHVRDFKCQSCGHETVVMDRRGQ